jgi:hypothetical protein
MSDEVKITPILDRNTINRRIENLDISADMKALFARLLDLTIEVGGKLINLGRRLLTFVFEMAKAYPSTAIGLILALVLSHLVASIPFLGPVLSAFLTPIVMIYCVGAGWADDTKDGAMRRRVAGLEAQFRAMGVA